MRNAFANTMTELAKERNDIVLLTGDIGNKMFDRYKEIDSKRFINCGIAEGNMMSVAAGMALTGLKPVVYTITPFVTTRCLEQIRTGVAYHEASVVIVGTGSGLSYAELGATHHSLEDLAIIRCIPNMQVCAPTDSVQLSAQLRESISSGKPTYIRIGKKGEPDLLSKNSNLEIGKANIVRNGTDILIIGVGPIISEALIAAEQISKSGVSVAVAALGSVKPIDEEFLVRMTEQYEYWISIEEHNLIGGVGSTLLEWFSKKQINKVKLTRMGTQDRFIHKIGKQSFCRQQAGLDSDGILETLNKLKRN